MPEAKINPQGSGDYTMNNIFGNLRVYASKWEEVDRRKFNKEELAAIKEAKVVESQYGSSVCFSMVSSGTTFIPLSNKSTLCVGDSVDLESAEIITLRRQGDADIIRIEA